MNGVHLITMIKNMITAMDQRNEWKEHHRNQMVITVIEPSGAR